MVYLYPAFLKSVKLLLCQFATDHVYSLKRRVHQVNLKGTLYVTICICSFMNVTVEPLHLIF